MTHLDPAEDPLMRKDALRLIGIIVTLLICCGWARGAGL